MEKRTWTLKDAEFFVAGTSVRIIEGLVFLANSLSLFGYFGYLPDYMFWSWMFC